LGCVAIERNANSLSLGYRSAIVRNNFIGKSKFAFSASKIWSKLDVWWFDWREYASTGKATRFFDRLKYATSGSEQYFVLYCI